ANGAAKFARRAALGPAINGREKRTHFTGFFALREIRKAREGEGVSSASLYAREAAVRDSWTPKIVRPLPAGWAAPRCALSRNALSAAI
ncbi:MAG: hypothetical protein WBE77_09500, partial [Candidatus Cybelea sp.]